jgi:hypothetical protein
MDAQRNAVMNYLNGGKVVKEEQNHFLALVGQSPARLTTEQTAWLLGCQPHDVPILVSTRLLKPLGNPPPNGIKFFATVDVLELAKDRSWLAKVTNSINQHWHNKNARQKRHVMNGAENDDSAKD